MPKDDSLAVPSGDFTLTMKAKATGADHYEALEASLGERDRYGDNMRLGYAIYSRFLAANLITSWDRTHFDEEKAETVPLPITPQTVASIEDADDYQFVIHQAISRVRMRSESAEAGFAKPSTPGTAATSSSPKTSRRSRS